MPKRAWRGVEAWSLRRILAERSDGGAEVLVARKSERAFSNSEAVRRHSPQWARCDSNCARSPAVKSPSCRRDRKSGERAGWLESFFMSRSFRNPSRGRAASSTAPAPAVAVFDRVVRDRGEPGARRRLGPEAGEPPVSLEEDLLRHVVRFLLADRARHPPVNRRCVPPEELAERLFFPFLREENQFFVGQIRQAQVQVTPPTRGGRDCTRAIGGG